MPLLTVRHVTTYRYRQPVAFGEHRMMLRPREGHDQRLIEASLDIVPAPRDLRWLHDVFGNSVAIARFAGRHRELRFDSRVRLDHRPLNALDFTLAEHAEIWPFAYDTEEMPDLARSIERHWRDPERAVDRWARRFLRRGGPTGTMALLEAMTHAIREELTYIPRHERGIQEPAKTLALGSGTCRDFAVLMMEAARSLGLAARFVSGYLYSPGRDGEGHRGGGNTHAWARIYLPGAGWVEFDPTNGILGNRDLIRVAIARDPAQALPLHGTWTGFPADSLGMEVEVSVTAAPVPAIPVAATPVPKRSTPAC
ncbi:transglutaminase family protein [Paracraurococcus lichenis]|uniref:Transglutaminase family protein n=1 Tax=Paracraurococcus lichenis TaxID=3064888 RepID=A0ABT9E3D8_9PROT|nr:transglutaminase family protein [Paracraurococcus sp. LOR1-02]MDO9710622.1 transglutaminase family protein [Paracraurococcus sp. LOR1-02]